MLYRANFFRTVSNWRCRRQHHRRSQAVCVGTACPSPRSPGTDPNRRRPWHRIKPRRRRPCPIYDGAQRAATLSPDVGTPGGGSGHRLWLGPSPQGGSPQNDQATRFPVRIVADSPATTSRHGSPCPRAAAVATSGRRISLHPHGGVVQALD